MKSIFLFTVSLLFSSQLFAASFSAFSIEDTLYVTIMTDGCNAYGVSLEVHPLCRSDRWTKNYAVQCNAKLSVNSTEMACEGKNAKAQVFELSLKDSKVAPEAKLLVLDYINQTITVDLK